MKKSIFFFLLMVGMTFLGLSSCDTCSDCGPEQTNPYVVLNFFENQEGTPSVRLMATAYGIKDDGSLSDEFGIEDSVTTMNLPLDMNTPRAKYRLEVIKKRGEVELQPIEFDFELTYDLTETLDPRNIVRVVATNVKPEGEPSNGNDKVRSFEVICNDESADCISEHTNVNIVFILN
ncbi:hypothetical protein [Persicobacter diffluens]